jgi:hypothetical protein
MNNDDSVKLTIGTVLRCLCKNPYRHIIRRWNWKTAFLSAFSRGLVILLVYLPFGGAGAFHGMAIELLYRGLTAGIFSAIIQAFRFARPFWAASAVTMILIPGMADVMGVSAQWISGTNRLGPTIVVSIVLSGISVFIELHAMRNGALIMGGSSKSFIQDLKQLPSLMMGFWADCLDFIRMVMKQIQKNPAGI